ncbi:dihydrodiol dehydrogenase [Comamonas sp. Z1]|uniref:hypothetical protein n=1 Tax=Comamonas TaxID=283 RepID=UPI0006B94587|nr:MULTISPECIES: hypothetical protein [Comamonas]TYK71014.1 dihydrodiol dehydrogenase [Comamonas sp. Z1]TYK73390.1 dihydrodiol dehydrogenase [Comamonas sp. Z3]
MSSYFEPSDFLKQGVDVPDAAFVGEPIVVANEFTAVALQKVAMRQGERVLLKVMPDGSSLLLDAMQLEAITRLRPEDFSRLLARNLGVE